MKRIIDLFTWVASGLVNAICPGGALVENIAEELQRYNESITQVAECMQRAWRSALKTLEAALGGGGWLTPKSHQQLGERLRREVIAPLAIEKGLIGAKMESYLQRALCQCRKLIELETEVIDFTSQKEEDLLAGLGNVGRLGIVRDDVGMLIIDSIQKKMPDAKELLELLWHRNLLLEGLVAHFTIELSHRPSLAIIVGHIDRRRIQGDLSDIKGQIKKSLENNDFAAIGVLGAKASQVAAVGETQVLQEDYQRLMGDLLGQIGSLAKDQETIKDLLGEILQRLSGLTTLQKSRGKPTPLYPEAALSFPSAEEIKLSGELTDLVKQVGWERLNPPLREEAANTLARTYYSSRNLERAISALESAAAAGAENAEMDFNLFQVLQSAGRTEEALAHYQKAVTRDPQLALFPAERYQILDIIGKGGMGMVYKVYDLQKKQLVAIKVLILPEEHFPGARERFLQAAAASTRLAHENIVTVYSFDQLSPAHPFLVMEYLEGDDLSKVVQKQGPFSLAAGGELALQIAAGLSFAHHQGFVHRDLKPGNIVLTPTGAKIIDFGLSKFERDSTLTLTAESYYTPHYSAPEQRLDFHSADQRSDIYSFGKTLYYLFTGDEPFDIDWDDVPEKIRPILRKATRKDPSHRFASVEKMAESLQSILHGGESENQAEEGMDSDCFPIAVLEEPKVKREPLAANLLKSLPSGFQYHNGVIMAPDQVPMVFVPAGSFFMGSESEDADYDEKPVHEVYLEDYLVDMYPVTNACYASFLEAIGGEHHPPWCHPDEPPGKSHIPQFWYHSRWNAPHHPVVGVDWWDAYAYAQWAGKTLPAEAQWEKAARGVDGRIYPWGNDPPDPSRCNFNNLRGATVAVNSVVNDRSPYGCSNMAGNVWEWCLDWYDSKYYYSSPSREPGGPLLGRSPVGRGGCWSDYARNVRTTARGRGTGRGDRNHHLGFRTVLKLLPEVEALAL